MHHLSMVGYLAFEKPKRIKKELGYGRQEDKLLGYHLALFRSVQEKAGETVKKAHLFGY